MDKEFKQAVLLFFVSLPNPNDPFMGDKTPKDLVKEINDETEFGLKIYTSLIKNMDKVINYEFSST